LYVNHLIEYVSRPFREEIGPRKGENLVEYNPGKKGIGSLL
jgi:hypothetical protein